MKTSCRLCGMDLIAIAVKYKMCPRCDTVAQGGGMRVGPPNNPNTNNGWFSASFSDKT